DGTFQGQLRFVVGTNPVSVAVADVNGDGHPDLVVANYDYYSNSNDVSVLLGKGDGTFQGPLFYGAGGLPSAVVVADVNGDGHPDLVVNIGVVSVLLGKGDGTFQGPQFYGAGGLPSAVVVADVNGDGYPDLVTANAAIPTSSDVSVLLGKGDS